VRSLNAACAKNDLFKMRGLVVRLYSYEVSHIYRMVLTAHTSLRIPRFARFVLQQHGVTENCTIFLDGTEVVYSTGF
jgi:hypothetical protein